MIIESEFKDFKVIRTTNIVKREIVFVSAYDEEEASEKACLHSDWLFLSDRESNQFEVTLYMNDDEENYWRVK